jgi:dTDP-4-amino-4,6-dideoxygalactose transaminase
MARLNDMLDRRWLTNNGVYVQEFEKEVAAIAKTRHCIAVSNATVGLEITIRALGLHGEVIVPAFTYVATAHALHWQGITPVFCDVDPETHMLDPGLGEELITPQTTGIVGVHIWGRTCNTEALERIARRRGLMLIFDAAHAFGCSQGGGHTGGFGNAEVFSFHATKFLNSFEGGAIVTNDPALAEKIRLMQNLGFADYDQVVCSGTNGKMSEASAAMGLTSLESMDEFIAINRRNYEWYKKELCSVRGLRLLMYEPDHAISNYQYVVIEIDQDKAGLTRDLLLAVLHAENVLARRYFYPGCHRMEPYRSLYPDINARLPNTERLSDTVLVLPTGTSVDTESIQTICNITRITVENSSSLMKCLNRPSNNHHVIAG